MNCTYPQPFPIQGENGAYARAFGAVPRPDHCPFCRATEPECTEEPALNTHGSSIGNDPDNNGRPGLWLCRQCDREFGEDDLDLAEPEQTNGEMK